MKRLLIGLLFLTGSVLAEEKAPIDLTEHTPTAYDICIHNQLLNGADTLTVGEIRQRCVDIKAPKQPLSSRRLSEVLTEKNPFVITPHRLNYAMLGHYLPSVNQAPFESQTPNTPLNFENTELQF